MLKKKSIVTFGHVSPWTLRSKVPAKSFPPWNGVMRVTVDLTSRFPAGTNLARMVRCASPFWIFFHVSFNISYPLSFPPSHIRSLSLSLSPFLIRSLAALHTWLLREPGRGSGLGTGLDFSSSALQLRHIKAPGSVFLTRVLCVCCKSFERP